jgi:hypothetical protein
MKPEGNLCASGGLFQFPDDALADPISPLHLCSVNCNLRLSWASATLFMAVSGDAGL